MPLRGIQDKMSSGELTEVKVGGTDPVDLLITKAESTLDIDTAVAQPIGEKQFIPSAPPTQAEGKVFYDQDKHALSVYSDVDMTLNLGQEEVIRVFNNSGALIPNATPVYISGATLTLPTVAPAIASAFSTASVPGITTHAIPDGQEGFITHAGSLGGDFSAFNEGDTLFLSDTIPGGFTTSPPDIVTSLGLVAVNEVDGTLVVSIGSLKELPTVVAFMQDGDVPTTIDATPTAITNYVDGGNVTMQHDPVTGTITTATSGIYRVSAIVNISHDDTGNNAGSAWLSLFDGTVDIVELEFSVAKNQEGTNLIISGMFEAVAGQVTQLRVRSDPTLTNVAANAAVFSMESISIR